MGRSPAEYEKFQETKKGIRAVAWRMATIGAIFTVVAIAMTVGHYAFNVPIYYGRSPSRLATDVEIIGSSALFGFGGLAFFILGLLFGCGRKGTSNGPS